MSDWISVKDKLPENDQKVIIYINFHNYDGEGDREIEMTMQYVSYGEYINPCDTFPEGCWFEIYSNKTRGHSGSKIVTHWMPLPECPENAEPNLFDPLKEM